MKCETSSRPIFDLTKHRHPRALHSECVRYIRGIRGIRETAVSRKQIGIWLHRTSAEAIDIVLCDLVKEGKIVSEKIGNKVCYRLSNPA